jgi:hypothetical protein
MCALVICKHCGTPLLTTVTLERDSLQAAFFMSSVALRGNGYALNVCRSGPGGCPICGGYVDGIGIPPPTLGARVECVGRLDEDSLEFLKRHAFVHLRHDLRMMSAGGRSLSAGYMFAYSALRHFALAGTLSVFNGAIGPMALLSKETSQEILKHLTDVVNEEMKSDLHPYRYSVDAFSIKGATCVVVTPPVPSGAPEPHLIAIVTGANITKADSAKNESSHNVLYFSLEHSRVGGGNRTILGGWTHDGRRNYGFGPNPVVEDFVACVERVWVSEIWRLEQK